MCRPSPTRHQRACEIQRGHMAVWSSTCPGRVGILGHHDAEEMGVTPPAQKYHIINYLVQWTDPSSMHRTQTRVVNDENEARRIVDRVQTNDALQLTKAVKRDTWITETSFV